MAETPDDILRALADPERLAIAGALARGDLAARELADTLELPIARVRKHLNRLTATGVARLAEDRRTYRLDPETLRWAAEQVGPPRDAGLALGAANDDEEIVLRTFFRNGRLTEIPGKAAKRRIVLERIASEFEPGVHYDEKEVNATVGAFFNDYASLRRYLVDEGFLDREGPASLWLPGPDGDVGEDVECREQGVGLTEVERHRQQTVGDTRGLSRVASPHQDMAEYEAHRHLLHRMPRG